MIQLAAVGAVAVGLLLVGLAVLIGEALPDPAGLGPFYYLVFFLLGYLIVADGEAVAIDPPRDWHPYTEAAEAAATMPTVATAATDAKPATAPTQAEVAAARDEASAARLWEVSETLTGVRYPLAG